MCISRTGRQMIQDPSGNQANGDAEVGAEGAPPGPRPHRGIRCWVLLGVAMVVIIALAAVLLTVPSDNHHPNGRVDASPTRACQLKVTHQGFSIFHSYSDGRRDQAFDDSLQYAFLITNPCRLAATGIHVYALPKIASGKSLRKGSEDGAVVSGRVDLGILLPGRTVGLYGKISNGTDRGGERYNVHDAVRVSLDVKLQCWRRAVGLAPKTRSVAEDVRVGPPNADGYAKDRIARLRFTLRLDPVDGKIQERSVWAIFRDHSGRILAGGGDALPTDARSGQQQEMEVWLPPHADRSKTRVYLTTMRSNGLATPTYGSSCSPPNG